VTPMKRPLLLTAIFALQVHAAPRPVTFTDYAGQFDRFEASTSGMPPERRVPEFRARFDAVSPGLYRDEDEARLERRIKKALAEFPAIRPTYQRVERRFPGALTTAVERFRQVFPEFVPPLPIYLVHSLGTRDGGSDYLGGRKVMLFGADVIARIHNDDSLQPFLTHELFHLEHARHFADCDQLWCPLWQEGLATFATSTMTPGATDHQLLLDQPAPIRPQTDAHWPQALCWIAARFDATDSRDIGAAFTGSEQPPDLPSRFGYYVGLRIAAEVARGSDLPAITQLGDENARPAVVTALASLITAAHAPCQPPNAIGPITHANPRPA
jgi:hypothetical protein